LDPVLSLQKELVFVLYFFYNFGFKEPYRLGLYMISMSFLKGLWILIVGKCNACNLVSLLRLIIFHGQWFTIVVLAIFQLTLGDLTPLFHTHLDVYDKPS